MYPDSLARQLQLHLSNYPPASTSSAAPQQDSLLATGIGKELQGTEDLQHGKLAVNGKTLLRLLRQGQPDEPSVWSRNEMFPVDQTGLAAAAPTFDAGGWDRRNTSSNTEGDGLGTGNIGLLGLGPSIWSTGSQPSSISLSLNDDNKTLSSVPSANPWHTQAAIAEAQPGYQQPQQDLHGMVQPAFQSSQLGNSTAEQQGVPSAVFGQQPNTGFSTLFPGMQQQSQTFNRQDVGQQTLAGLQQQLGSMQLAGTSLSGPNSTTHQSVNHHTSMLADNFVGNLLAGQGTATFNNNVSGQQGTLSMYNAMQRQQQSHHQLALSDAAFLDSGQLNLAGRSDLQAPQQQLLLSLGGHAALQQALQQQSGTRSLSSASGSSTFHAGSQAGALGSSAPGPTLAELLQAGRNRNPVMQGTGGAEPRGPPPPAPPLGQRSSGLQGNQVGGVLQAPAVPPPIPPRGPPPQNRPPVSQASAAVPPPVPPKGPPPGFGQLQQGASKGPSPPGSRLPSGIRQGSSPPAPHALQSPFGRQGPFAAAGAPAPQRPPPPRPPPVGPPFPLPGMPAFAVSNGVGPNRAPPGPPPPRDTAGRPVRGRPSLDSVQADQGASSRVAAPASKPNGSLGQANGLTANNVFKEFKHRNKHNNKLIMPPVCDIEAVSRQLEAMAVRLQAPQSEQQAQREAFRGVQEIVQAHWPHAKVQLFGSAANGLSIGNNNDIDVSVLLDEENTRHEHKVSVVEELGPLLEHAGMQEVHVLARARVPVVKFVYPRTGTKVDITVNNLLACLNTQLISEYCRIDDRLKQLILLVKHWAKSRNVAEAYKGCLSSYCYVIMCIHCLQRQQPPILPNLQRIKPYTMHRRVGEWEVAFNAGNPSLDKFGSHNSMNLAELLLAFFDYWTQLHDYQSDVVSIRLGERLTKSAKNWTSRVGSERHLICIEDPFQLDHDLGRNVDRHTLTTMLREFERADELLHSHPNPVDLLFEPWTPDASS